MEELIQEYGQTVIAAAGALLILGLLGGLFAAPEGLLAQLILLWSPF